MRRIIGTAALALTFAGCGNSLAGTERSIHDTLASLGFAESGARSSARLGEGETLQFPLSVEAGRCVALVAIGGGRVADVDVEVLRQDGFRAARDENVGATASATYCATSSEPVEVVVTATRGRGDVAVHVYDATGAGGGGGARMLGGTLAAACSAAEALPFDQPVRGTTDLGRHASDGSCFRGESPEVYYRLEVAVPSLVSLDLRSQYDGAIYVLRGCGGTELACNDDYAEDRAHAHVDVQLEPGEYVVVVDGYGGEHGAFELTATSTPLVPVGELCSAAPVLVPGTPLSGTTVGAVDRFAATCGGGGASPDRVHRLDVATRSRARIVQNSPGHDGLLFVRRACADETSELECNDDWNGIAASVVTTVLDPGSYYVYSDAYSGNGNGASGEFTLLAELGADAGTGVASDFCDAEVVSGGASVSMDTFAARDDASGTCGGQGGADVVRRIRATSRSRLRVEISAAQFTGHVYLRRARCDGEELACRGFELSRRTGGVVALETTVDAGEYYLFFDGADVENFGSLSARISIEDLAALERPCREAPVLAFGQDVRGSTQGGSSQFTASCAAEARSPDRVYRLVVRRRSYVSIDLRTDGFDGALHVRSTCSDAASELACNDDDSGDTARSRIERNFDPGTYYVIVDGYSESNSGGFTLRAETSAPRAEQPDPVLRTPPDSSDLKAASLARLR